MQPRKLTVQACLLQQLVQQHRQLEPSVRRMRPGGKTSVVRRPPLDNPQPAHRRPPRGFIAEAIGFVWPPAAHRPPKGLTMEAIGFVWPPAARHPPRGLTMEAIGFVGRPPAAARPAGRPPEGLGGGFAPILAFVGRFLGAFAPIWGHDLPLKTKKNFTSRPAQIGDNTMLTEGSAENRSIIGRAPGITGRDVAENVSDISLVILVF